MATMPKPTPMIDAENMIRTIAQDYTKYYNARDTDKLLSLFSTDARIFAPFHPMAEGNALRESIEQTYTEYDPKNLQVETLGVEVNGDLAFSFGTFKMNVRMPNGTRVDDQGKWTVFLLQTGTTWKITNHCWNSDLPLTTFVK